MKVQHQVPRMCVCVCGGAWVSRMQRAAAKPCHFPSRLGVRDTKQAEKAKSQLAKIRRQTVGLTKDEFHDKVRALLRRTAPLRELTS